ncbi:MAG TPA: hypothetical protein VGM84_10355 [Steroidobacteraceae bacterium]
MQHRAISERGPHRTRAPDTTATADVAWRLVQPGKIDPSNHRELVKREEPMNNMRHFAWPVLVVIWLVFLALPLWFLIAAPNVLLNNDGLAGIYIALSQLLGERAARWVFGGLWFATNLLVFWRVMLSKKRHELGPSLDLDDYG